MIKPLPDDDGVIRLLTTGLPKILVKNAKDANRLVAHSVVPATSHYGERYLHDSWLEEQN